MAIAQTGDIAPSALSLRFSASGAQYLSVSFNGVNLPFSQVGTGPNYGLFAADVSQFAGQSGELRFTEQAVPTSPLVILDNIFFSPTAIPEPSVLGMLATGAVFLAWRSVRRSRVKDKPTCRLD